jgi:hypothetical protein
VKGIILGGNKTITIHALILVSTNYTPFRQAVEFRFDVEALAEMKLSDDLVLRSKIV